MYKWNQVNCLTKIIQEIIAKYKLPDIKYKFPGQVYKHELKPLELTFLLKVRTSFIRVDIEGCAMLLYLR